MVEMREGRLEHVSGSGGYLEVLSLRFSYPTKSRGLGSVLRPKSIPALRDVSIVLDRGSILLIVGPNGSGKTTLISALSGLIKPDGGEIRISGREVGPEDLMRTASLLLGDRPPYCAKVRVRTLLNAISSLFDSDARSIALRLGLDLGDRYVHTLSRGQLARLAYSMWLAKRASMYLGDEVGMGLDDSGAKELARLLLEKAEGGVVVLTSPRVSNLFRHLISYST